MRVLSFLLVLIASASALVVTPGRYVVAPRAAAASSVQMGPAKDGPFTPFVLGAKVRFARRQRSCVRQPNRPPAHASQLVLGEQTLLKYRGKVISLHSQ